MVSEVSGPAELSKRTDLGVLKQSTQPIKAYTGGAYGNNKAMAEQQGSANLIGNPYPPITSITSPTKFPDEPITFGSDFGPGADSSILNLPTEEPTILSIIRKIAQQDSSGDSELIYRMLEDSGA